MTEPQAVPPENIRRLQVLFAELGLELGPVRTGIGVWEAGFTIAGIRASLELGANERFCRLVCRFDLDAGLGDWLTDRLDELQTCCWAGGCGHHIAIQSGRVMISLGLTLYYSGLQYYALKEAIDDLARAAGDIRRILEPGIEPVEGGGYGNT